MALREKRERKQLKMDQRAAGLLPTYDENGFEIVAEIDAEIWRRFGQTAAALVRFLFLLKASVRMRSNRPARQ